MEAKENTAMGRVYDLIYQQFHNEKEGFKVLTVDVLTIIQEVGKPLEKQQLIDAWNSGIDNCGEFNTPSIATGEQYYQEQFKQ